MSRDNDFNGNKSESILSLAYLDLVMVLNSGINFNLNQL